MCCCATVANAALVQKQWHKTETTKKTQENIAKAANRRVLYSKLYVSHVRWRA